MRVSARFKQRTGAVLRILGLVFLAPVFVGLPASVPLRPSWNDSTPSLLRPMRDRCTLELSMLIAADAPHRIYLDDHPGHIVLRVPTRPRWTIPPYDKDSSSGVWYFKNREVTELTELVATGDEQPTPAEFERLYVLRPEPLTTDTKHFAVHEFLVRYWQSDMDVPRFENLRIALVERRSDAGVEWELCLKNPGVTIVGVHFTGANISSPYSNDV
jgi:hypothetical protein